MNLLELSLIKEKKLNDIAIEEGTNLDVNSLFDNEEDTELFYNFYKNVNLIHG